MRNGVLFFLFAFASCIANANDIKLKGTLTQGALIIGQVDNASSIQLDGKPLAQTKDGHFVFGFARDAKEQAILTWSINGNEFSKTLNIARREYKIDRVNGVESKYVSPPDEVLARIKSDTQKVAAVRANQSNDVHFLKPFYRPAEGRISGVYGSQRIFNGVPKNPHYGLDIANKTGTPVYAPAPGTVILVDDLYYSGKTVILDHGFGVTSTFLHLNKTYVKVGDKLMTGEQFADIGATGRVTGPHLDWRINWRDERLDPALVMVDKLAVKEVKQ